MHPVPKKPEGTYKMNKETLETFLKKNKKKIKFRYIKMLAVTVTIRHSAVCNRLQLTFIKKQKL